MCGHCSGDGACDCGRPKHPAGSAPPAAAEWRRRDNPDSCAWYFPFPLSNSFCMSCEIWCASVLVCLSVVSALAGFMAGSKWADGVGAFINLESTGPGGPDVLFQHTGKSLLSSIKDDQWNDSSFMYRASEKATLNPVTDI